MFIMNDSELTPQDKFSGNRLPEGTLDDLERCIREILVAYSNHERVWITGYSPYFNDGDECVYSFNHWDICFDPENVYDSSIDGYVSRNFEISKFSFDNVARHMFGNHVIVGFALAGDDIDVIIEEFDHD